MSARSRVSIPTGVYGRAFLVKMWEARDQLTAYERRGFAQFFYLTICGHLEAVLAGIIKGRLRSVELAIRWEQLPPMRYTSGATSGDYSVAPIVATLRRLSAAVQSEVDSAPLSRLTDLHVRVFGRSIASVLGPEMSADINALATLRNLFAHGRDLFMEFEGESHTEYQGTLDGNALKFSAQRLHQAGVIDGFNITGLNYDDFFGKFFSDAALLHFHRVVREAEVVLRRSTEFVPEQGVAPLRALDELRA